MFLRDLKTCLFQTIYMNDIKMASSILSCGFDIESRDKYHRTPLMVAYMLQRPDFINLFLCNGADIFSVDSRNNGMEYYINLIKF